MKRLRDHPTPVRVRLKLERLRARGVEFDEAWRLATEFLPPPGYANNADANQWANAFQHTKEAWRAAYEGEEDAVEAVRTLRMAA